MWNFSFHNRSHSDTTPCYDAGLSGMNFTLCHVSLFVLLSNFRWHRIVINFFILFYCLLHRCWMLFFLSKFPRLRIIYFLIVLISRLCVWENSKINSSWHDFCHDDNDIIMRYTTKKRFKKSPDKLTKVTMWHTFPSNKNKLDQCLAWLIWFPLYSLSSINFLLCSWLIHYL